MKSENFTFIPLAFLIGCLVHLLLAVSFFMSKTSTHAYFSTGVMLTLVYFFLTAFSFAIIVFGPLELSKKNSENSKKPLNWWWHFYLGGWGLVALIILECFILKMTPNKIELELLTYTFMFFLIKNIFLIPSFFRAKEQDGKQFLIKVLGLIEILIFVAIYALFWIAGQMVPEFG